MYWRGGWGRWTDELIIGLVRREIIDVHTLALPDKDRCRQVGQSKTAMAIHVSEFEHDRSGESIFKQNSTKTKKAVAVKVKGDHRRLQVGRDDWPS